MLCGWLSNLRRIQNPHCIEIVAIIDLSLVMFSAKSLQLLFFEETQQLLIRIYYFYVWPSREQKGNDCDTMQKERRLHRRRRTCAVIAAFWQWCIARVTVKWPPRSIRISKLPLKLSYLITLTWLFLSRTQAEEVSGVLREFSLMLKLKLSAFAVRGGQLVNQKKGVIELNCRSAI